MGTPAWNREGGRHTCNSMVTDRAASPPAWPFENHGQACRSGECTVTAEAVMNNVGLGHRRRRSNMHARGRSSYKAAERKSIKTLIINRMAARDQI
jgi:hypothetical protein